MTPTLAEKLKFKTITQTRLQGLKKTESLLMAKDAVNPLYSLYAGESRDYAIEVFLDGNQVRAAEAAQLVVKNTLLYFYGDWRNEFKTRKGERGHAAWRSQCLWYEEVVESLPWACALSDWEAVRELADYPPENKLPEPAKASGETAWGWSLIYFLRDEPGAKVEEFLEKAEGTKAKRPKLLSPVLRALLTNDQTAYQSALLEYLAYYRKSEFKRELEKVLCLEGSTLYHLGRKQGYEVILPENVADHIIRFD